MEQPAPAAAEQPAPTPIEDAGAEDGPYLRGASWATCMKGFRPESTVERDLLRLGMLCGPCHGMRRLGTPLTGKLEAGKAVRHSLEAKKGQCFRAFAVASQPVTGFELRALAASGNRLAQASSASRWAVLDSQGVWCVTQDTAMTIELEASGGQGDYAMQVWLLP